jgi:hypothetical protein
MATLYRGREKVSGPLKRVLIPFLLPGRPISKTFEESADQWAFLVKKLGMQVALK